MPRHFNTAGPCLADKHYMLPPLARLSQLNDLIVGTRRVDLLVEFGGRKDVIELKLAKSYKALEQGLEQVAACTKRLGRPEGYLVLFELLDGQQALPFFERGEVEEIEHDGTKVVLLRA